MSVRTYLKALLVAAPVFLSSSAYGWTIDQSFDNQVAGKRCSPFWESNADTKVSAEKSATGKLACKMAVQKGEKGWGGGFVLPEYLHEGDSLWISFRLFVPEGFDYNVTSAGDHLKFVRITLRDSNKTPGRLDWLWSQEGTVPFYLESLERDRCTTNCNYKFGGDEAPVKGSWETYEMFAKFDKTSVDDGGTGVVRMWKNGKLLGERTDRPTMWPGSTEIVSVLLFSYWNGASPATQHLYLDDLKVTNEIPAQRDASNNPYIGVSNFSSK